MPKFSIASLPDLSGKVALVTGGTNGLGEISARNLALKGAKVYITARSAAKGQAAIDRANEHYKKLRAASPKNKGAPNGVTFKGTDEESTLDIHVLEADLTDMVTVKRAAEEFLAKETRLDILMNNAGVCAVDYSLTKDGLEVQNATNLISHYFLTLLLVPTLVATSKHPEYAPAPDGAERSTVRIVFISSLGHKLTPSKRSIDFSTLEGINDQFADTKFAAFRRYAMSKVGCIILARELSRLLRSPENQLEGAAGKKAISVLSADPGQSKTGLAAGPLANYGAVFKLYHVLAGPTFISPEQAVETQLFAAASPQVEARAMSGEYIVGNGKISPMSEVAQDKTGKHGKDLLAFSQEFFKKYAVDANKVWKSVGVKPPVPAAAAALDAAIVDKEEIPSAAKLTEARAPVAVQEAAA